MLMISILLMFWCITYQEISFPDFTFAIIIKLSHAILFKRNMRKLCYKLNVFNEVYG